MGEAESEGKRGERSDMKIDVSKHNTDNFAPYIDQDAEMLDLTRLTQLHPIKRYSLDAIQRRFGIDIPQAWEKIFDLGRHYGVKFVIAGGAVRDWIMGIFSDKEPEITDIDLFFFSEEDRVKFQFALEAGGGEVAKDNERVTNVQYCGCLVQLIKSFTYESPEHVIATFDFSVSQFAVSPVDDELYFYFGTPSLKDVKNRKLRINQITFPVSTMRRLLKYSRKGFYICNGVMLQVAHAVVRAPELAGLYVD